MTTPKFLSKQAVWKTEDQMTADTNMWISHNYEHLRGLYYHIANESVGNDNYRMKLWSMGVLSGAPDFCILLPIHWYLELKLPNGTLSPKQKSLHTKWRDNGIVVEVGWTAIEVVNIFVRIVGQPKFTV